MPRIELLTSVEPVTATPAELDAAPLCAMRLPVPALVPPTTLLEPTIKTPPPVLPNAILPVTSAPMMLPSAEQC